MSCAKHCVKCDLLNCIYLVEHSVCVCSYDVFSHQ